MPARTELSGLAARYDLIVVGGGITGAGILREAVRNGGASVLLVEQRDFASGTSCASSKLVHGGLRYLKNGQWRLTLESVRERQRLLDEAAGLVEPQPFLMPIYRGRKPRRGVIQAGLYAYDLMAGRRGSHSSRWLDAKQVLELEPRIRREDLLGAMHYQDARTDDARLVLRLLLDSIALGASARNYTRAELRRDNGRVIGVRLIDGDTGASREIDCGLVVNATGAWAGGLPGAPEGGPKLRPLRGSHLVFEPARLPVQHAVSWMHPQDHRPIFAYPWEGAVIYGTTDLDHTGSLDDAGLSAGEVEYLMQGLAFQFPELALQAGDAIASYSGIRPVVASGKKNPSAESRESAMWASPGLVNITGGKLTTFRVTARQALREAARQLPQLQPAADAPVFMSAQPVASKQRLYGRLGIEAAGRLLQELPGDELERVGATPYCWAELRWAARHEQVLHLDDLLLRRTRIGLVTTGGGAAILPRLAAICREELGWDAARWDGEQRRYLEYWRRHHAPPS